MNGSSGRIGTKRKSASALALAKRRAALLGGTIYDKSIPSVPPPDIWMIEGAEVRSPEFLKTYAWRDLRYRALRATKGHCECCGAGPQHGARLNVDHILPRIERPDLALDPDNLQVLCDDCNAGKGNLDRTDWR